MTGKEQTPPVGLKSPTPVAKTAFGYLKCIAVVVSHVPAVVDKHVCTKEEHLARFTFSPDGGEQSHPKYTLELRSLSPMPYVQGEYYDITLSPRSKA